MYTMYIYTKLFIMVLVLLLIYYFSYFCEMLAVVTCTVVTGGHCYCVICAVKARLDKKSMMKTTTVLA